MAELTAQRTLVKSPPELWAELSEVENLARHLGELGEIRITRTKPETTVAWEGEQISGTVVLKESGWGTKVIFHATVPEPDGTSEPEADAAPESAAETSPERAETEPAATLDPARVEHEPAAEATTVEFEAIAVDAEPKAEAKRPGFIARWLFRERSPAPAPTLEPTPTPKPVVEAPPVEAVTEPESEPAPEPVAEAPQPEPVITVTEPEAAAEAVTAEPEPEDVEQPVGPDAVEEPTAERTDVERVQQVLDGVLENLGQAHHRPFSRG